MSEPLAQRLLARQLDRHRLNIGRDIDEVRRRAAALPDDLHDPGGVTIALGSAKTLAREVAELVANLSALNVATDLESLIHDAPEPPARDLGTQASRPPSVTTWSLLPASTDSPQPATDA